jgi:hypothetical protein
MYRNTMYIPTITSWLQSQWQSYIATKSHLWVPLSQQFSSRQRTPKNNTEYRTSVQQKLLCYNNNKENSEKKQTQKRFFTVTVCDKSRDKLTETQNSKQQFNLILDIFYIHELMLQNCTHCITTVFRFFIIITVIVPLQKFRQRTSQRSYYERSQ